MCSFDCMSHSTDYLNETALVAARLGEQGVGIDNCVRELLEVRGPNSQTRHVNFPLPKIEDLLLKQGKCQVFFPFWT